MSGVIHNTTNDRYFEAGQMVNHIDIYQNTLITESYKAYTEVTAVKFSRETFLKTIN